LVFKGKNLGFRSREKVIAQGELGSLRSLIPALKDGAFRAIWVNCGHTPKDHRLAGDDDV
jgi:hypothetical protein